MSDIKFESLERVDPDDLMALLNQHALRVHLVDHDYFDSRSIRAWISDKLEIDSSKGCRVRAVTIDGALAGWCGIQPDEQGFELAIVLAKEFWGFGLSIYKTMMMWANELGHKQVLFHLLDSRPEYKALRKLAVQVCKTELMGRCFTTYYFPVPN